MCIFGGNDNSAVLAQSADQKRLTTLTATGFDAAGYLKANPDVMAEYSKVTAPVTDKDKQNAWYYNAGLDSPESFAAYHYTTSGKAEGRTWGQTADTPATTATDLTSTAQTATDKATTDATDATTKVISGLTTDLTNLTTQINGMASTFATSQTDLISQMQAASAAQSASIAKAISDAANQSGQAAKKPNYAQALAKNKELNGGGLSATMLTGPQGVAPSAMTLGATSLIGA